MIAESLRREPQTEAEWLGPLPVKSWFAHPERRLEIDLGSGKGRFLLARAAKCPETNFLGIDRMLRRIRKVDNRARRLDFENVRLLRMEAYYAVAYLVPPAAVDAYYVFFPDPWPKARHAKRRMMNDGPLDLIAAKLKPGGEFRFGTDHPVYLAHALMVMRRHRHQFEWLAKDAQDFLVRPGGWPETRYEHKARTVYGHEVWYFRYRRQ